MLCSHSLIKGLGLYETSCGDFTNLTIQHKLVACIVDGVIYGDTTLVVSVENGQNPIETEFKLEQNYPNPFNPTTSIQYAIGSRQFVTIKVYDVLGNEIATLVNEEKPAGEYEVEFDAVGLPSGVYFYQLKSGSFTETKKMILLR
ncbi:MAG: T9SS type A sorting domain-containing protein [Ignavibacteriaceae bacterium]|nr:T9SS type A sorting domain-containing protein [Ignavibacteriaceae bacterium]